MNSLPPCYRRDGISLYHGDVLDVLPTLPAASVHCVVTSPPYWGLRDYGTASWEGGVEGCNHDDVMDAMDPVPPACRQCKKCGRLCRTRWLDPHTVLSECDQCELQTKHKNVESRGLWSGIKDTANTEDWTTKRTRKGRWCRKCGARRIDQQLGLEATPEEYVKKMVAVFRQVWRVLRDDGCCFINLGDSYFGGGGGGGGSFSSERPGWREVPCGTSDKAPGGSQGRGCLCENLCGACRVAYQTGKSHSDGRPAPTLSPSPCEPTPERKESASARPPTSDSLPPAARNEAAMFDPGHSLNLSRERPPSSRRSTPGGFSQQLPASCPPPNMTSVCLLCGQTLGHDVQAFAGRATCTCDTAMQSGASAHRTSDISFSDSAYPHYTTTHLKSKDLCGIPWMVAFALRADGWYLRSDIIWSKPNPMPESVTDRPTKAHEYLFLLTKQPRYFYDADAVREAGADTPWHPIGGYREGNIDNAYQPAEHSHDRPTTNRNRRTVWTIPTAPYPEAHFATFPPALVEPCIMAGTSEKGCCPECGAPWVRVVDKQRVRTSPGRDSKAYDRITGEVVDDGMEKPWRDRAEIGNRDPGRHVTETKTLGWKPGCGCNAGEPIPCTVADIFLGSGTTLQVARWLGRKGIGIELSEEYLKLAEKRIRQPRQKVPIAKPLNGQMELF